jgi:hypothetical protein
MRFIVIFHSSRAGVPGLAQQLPVGVLTFIDRNQRVARRRAPSLPNLPALVSGVRKGMRPLATALVDHAKVWREGSDPFLEAA